MRKVLTILTLLTCFLASVNSTGNVKSDRQILSEQLAKLDFVFDEKDVSSNSKLFDFITKERYQVMLNKRKNKYVSLGFI
ncbi:hypothetical protein [Zooshikella ganghwensis]|uniref:Uncharacterized protein n=1 Tax=Zooshikella ganghwensis TaxID=202772 RepID=A0A4P9VRG6_9GAMM|nr:hypothetical protein [Zooshikella ganghwensis]RDH46185.1 hypothetical protein B9G39_23555 [Zooshikella ganghwensis]